MSVHCVVIASSDRIGAGGLFILASAEAVSESATSVLLSPGVNRYIEALIAFHIVVGAFFVVVGSFGLLKLPTLMSRLHGPSKATTLGVGGCLIASMIHFGSLDGRLSIQEILITFFLFITAPVTAHFVAKAHMHREIDPKRDLPKPDGLYGWSTFSSVTDVRMVAGDNSGSSDPDA
jgi:multicomponent K+:H+ antiporter subunit G